MECFNSITEEYNRIYLEVGKCNLKQQDLLHKIENSSFNAAQGYKLAMELKQVREQRRDCKNEMAVIQEIKNNFVDKNESQLHDVFESAKAKNDTLDQLKENKVYNNRIDDNGKIVFTTNRKLYAIQKQLEKGTA
jgi:dsDNA-specific endonuclease/ATPase MutS2